MSLYDQKNKAFLWNLSACHPYKFENKTWCFLFLVSFGCKGFFALSQAQIAETLFHELMNNTLFLKNRLQFNENLASFFGKKASIDYLNFFHDPHAKQMADYLSDLEDSEKFRQHILRGKRILEVLYQSFGASDDLNFKAAKKSKPIRDIVNHLDTIQFTNINYYSIFDESLPNNTYFMS